MSTKREEKFNLSPRVSRGPYKHITEGIDDRKTSFKQFFVRNSDLRTAVRELKKSHNGKRSFAGEISPSVVMVRSIRLMMIFISVISDEIMQMNPDLQRHT